MARLQFEEFGRAVQLATSGIEPAAISAQLAAFARSELARVIESGEGSIVYDRYVNGRRGTAEETVEPPGPILYEFIWWRPILGAALDFCRDNSPVRSGDYRKSWFVMVNGARVTDFGAIGSDVDVYVFNDRPYHRKIDVGHMKMSVPPGIIERARMKLQRQFGGIVDIWATHVTLPNGYILKGHFQRGHRQQSRRSLRSDTKAGAQMTYPALQLRIKAA